MCFPHTLKLHQNVLLHIIILNIKGKRVISIIWCYRYIHFFIKRSELTSINKSYENWSYLHVHLCLCNNKQIFDHERISVKDFLESLNICYVLLYVIIPNYLPLLMIFQKRWKLTFSALFTYLHMFTYLQERDYLHIHVYIFIYTRVFIEYETSRFFKRLIFFLQFLIYFYKMDFFHCTSFLLPSISRKAQVIPPETLN